MSLPNYIVNLEELMGAIIESYKSMKLFDNGHQRSKGFTINSLSKGVQEIEWVADRIIAITKISFSQNDVRNLGYDDYFNLLINDKVVFENVYFKEMREQKVFRNKYLLGDGDKLKIQYVNQTNIPKTAFFDIDYIEAVPPQRELIVICLDENGEELQRFNSYYTAPVSVDINPPEIEGYEAINSPYHLEIGLNDLSTSPITVSFSYAKVEVETPPDPNIDHLYDWKFVLRWEGRVDTDLDFHAYLDNAHVYYEEREFEIDLYNKVWYDIDHTSHPDIFDYQDKPEIITVLGTPSDTVLLSVVNFRNGHELNEKVTVEVYKVKDNKEILVQTIDKNPDQFYEDEAEVYFCRINLTTGEITNL